MTDAAHRTRVRAVWTISVLCLAVIACILPASGGETSSTRALGDPARPIDRAALDRQLDQILQSGRDAGMALSVWVGEPSGDAWYARDADVWRPAASSIKTAYLIELFTAHADGLDAPLEGAATIVSDPTHPAIVHFDADTQKDIREHLSDASVREIGRMMIRGTGVSNAVYNAAANVTTAVLGGPAALTALMRERDPAFAGLVSRRYMLAARDVTGDNEATAASLAAALQRIAAHEVRGVDQQTVDAMRAILHVPEDDGPDGEHYFKSGSLDSDPLTRILSGFWDGPAGTLVYVVMVEQPTPGVPTRDAAGERLAEISAAVADAVLAAARQAATL